jgi:hypothetical protein
VVLEKISLKTIGYVVEYEFHLNILKLQFDLHAVQGNHLPLFPNKAIKGYDFYS